MPLERLDHVNLRTAQLASMRRFYTEILGLSLGPRPSFSFDGAWLYCGPVAVVHLVAVEQPTGAQFVPSLEHFAFSGSDLGDLLERLDRNQQGYRLGVVRDAELCQVHLHDPDGNHLHLDYALREAELLGRVSPGQR